MAADEIIEQLEAMPPEELRRIKSAVDARLAWPAMTEEELEIEMERQGLLTRPKPGPIYDPVRDPPIVIEGEPLSEELLRERR